MVLFNHIKSASKPNNPYKRITMLLPVTAGKIANHILEALNYPSLLNTTGAEDAECLQDSP
jgi:hypothetical protein